MHYLLPRRFGLIGAPVLLSGIVLSIGTVGGSFGTVTACGYGVPLTGLRAEIPLLKNVGEKDKTVIENTGKDALKITKESVNAPYKFLKKSCEGIELKTGEKCESEIERVAAGLGVYSWVREYPAEKGAAEEESVTEP